MSLIFAIDNDKRQSAQLASLLRAQVEADLVQSTSVSEGLAILQDRVPDLILTSTLLSPRDETALAGYLRDLGGRGAHVQTLTIPVLAAGPAAAKGKKKAGVLGALRREKTMPSRLEGCSPDAFAREVQQYLARALERRASEPAATNVLSLPPERVHEPGPEPEPMRAMGIAAEFDSNVRAADPAPGATEIPLILLAPVVEVVAPSILLVAPLAEAGLAASTESAPLESRSFLLGDPAPAPAPEPSGWTLVMPQAPEAGIAPLIIETVKAPAPLSFVIEAPVVDIAAAKEAAAKEAAAKEAAAKEAAAKAAAAKEAAAKEAAAKEAAAKEAAAKAAAAKEAAAKEAAAKEAAAKAAAAKAAAAKEAAAKEAAAKEAAAKEAAAKEAAAKAAAAKAAAAKEAAAKEAAAKEAAAKEAAAKEAAAKAAAAKEAAAKEAAAKEAAAKEAAAKEAAAKEAAAKEAAAKEAAAKEAAAKEAAAKEAAAKEAAAKEAAAKEAAAKEAAAKEAAAKEAAAKEAAAKEAAAKEAAAKEAAAKEAAAKEAAAKEAAAKEAAAKEAAAKEAAAKEAAAKEAAAQEAAAKEAAAKEAAAQEAAAAAEEAAAKEAASAPQTPGFGDIYMDAPERVAETVVDLSQAAVAAGAPPAEGDVPVVDMAKADDLDALSRHLADEQSLFVPEPVVPEVPAAVFLKDMPALDPSIFVDAPEPVPATPLVDRPYAGLAFEDIFLSAKDRKRAVAATDEQTAAFDAAPAPAPEPAVVDSVAVEAIAGEAAESIETVTAAVSTPDALGVEAYHRDAADHLALESAWDKMTRALEPPVSLDAFASLNAPPMDDAVASNRIDEPEAQAVAPDTQAPAAGWTLEAEPEAAPEADTRFSLIEAEMPMAQTPAAGTSATAPVEAASTPPAWSWMESEASTPLADILAAVAQAGAQAEPGGSAQAEPGAADQVTDALAAEPVAAAAEEATPAPAPAATQAVAAWTLVEASVAEEPVAEDAVAAGEAPVAEAPVAEVIAAPVVPEVFNPDAVANWNAATAFGAVPAEQEESPAEPVTIEEVAAAPAPVVSGSPVVNGVIEVHDPVRAAAWRSAMAGRVADVPSRAAATVPAPVPTAPEPDTPPAVDEWGGQTGPVLGEEFLALIGNAARQASLDAFDALDQASTPEPAPERRERPRPRSSARGNRPVPSPKQRRKKPRPAQDEWGMFDPAQCGPDALLDEDAWEEEPDDRRPSPRGRSAA